VFRLGTELPRATEPSRHRSGSNKEVRLLHERSRGYVIILNNEKKKKDFSCSHDYDNSSHY
jgi:hypothetical protein